MQYCKKIILVAGLCAPFAHADQEPTVQEPKVMVFDLGGVIFDVSFMSKIKYMGGQALGYLFLDFKNPASIQNRFFQVMASLPLPAHPAIQAATRAAQEHLPTWKGHLLPMPMYLQQCDIVPNHELLKLMVDHIEVLDQQKFFCSAREKQIIIKATYAAFDPETRLGMTTPIKEGVKLLNRCAQQRDKKNSKISKILVLSNMDGRAIEGLAQANPGIWANFDGVMYSGQEKCLKPDPQIFLNFLKRYNLKPENCIFIDDQPENIAVAQALGFTAILCDDFAKVNKELKKLGVFE